MLETIQNRFALSEKGARDLLKGVFFTTLLNLGLMLPAVYTFVFLDDYLRGVFDPARAPAHGLPYYSLLGLGFMLVTWAMGLLQYRSTYTTIYEESANRRISLAEKLRKLPLAFFGRKNLSDLTSTIMSDNTDLEHTFSHAVPQLFASFVSLLLIAVGLIIYEWRLALALFWSVPVAAAMVSLSKAWQHRGNRLIYLDKRAVSEGIQEGLEMVQEIRSCRMEKRYLGKLDQIIDTFERNMTRVELLVGLLVNGAASVLRLGTASVIVAGAHLVLNGTVGLFTYLVFLLVASRVFEPIGEVFNNLAALFFLDVRIDRMREMQALPIQKGDTAFVPTHYDIEFNEGHIPGSVNIPLHRIATTDQLPADKATPNVTYCLGPQ